ncbi:hypothetical protein CCACVL1_21596 [Corchorus capsularis]|uniref:SET domain-containing protein n=1 Tax=Corchorus capsularis TaxID=210143 RepID=A0A1R3H3W4_COCAP|nr:hypothetical protein CCACVL1_21596 [Corchorus capsularis]
MAPDPRAILACRAMADLGISKDRTKPVLKRLLKLYDKNWEMIMAENYRVLIDAIFDDEDSKVSECKIDKINDGEDIEEGLTPDELERPLKRTRRNQEVLGSSSHSNNNTNVAGNILKMPKVEEDELSPALQQQSLELPTSPGNLAPQPASPVSPHHDGLNKGKELVAVGPSALQRQPLELPTSPGHIAPQPVSPVSPHQDGRNKGKQLVVAEPDTHALIIPKEEPLTVDMHHDEVPITVIHPDTLSRRDSPIRAVSTENREEPLESMQADENGGGGASAAKSEQRTSCQLAANPDETPGSLEIASSQLGEVKISISYNSALGRPNFQMPSIDELRGLMEQRCLRSYKLIDPNFDVIKILNDMCECISEIASNSSNQSQEGIAIPALDVLKKSPARNALGAECNKNGCLPARMSNGSLNVECSANGCVDNVEGKALVVVPEHQLTPNQLRWLHDANDVTRGEEKVEISWANEINTDFPSPFQYISENLVFQNAHVSFSLSQIGDESCCPTCFGDCLLSQQPCACASQAGKSYVYASAGVVKEDFLEECISMTRDPQQQCLLYCTECPLERSKKNGFPETCKGHIKRKVIKECWSRCGCNMKCGNRVVQRGVNYKLQVFLTPDGKGWGLRTLEKLPKGAFVCEFVGEILTISELYARNTQKLTFPILLDAYWGLKGASKDEEALCLDAASYGNVARFINHRCLDANLIEIPVEVETPDHHYYHVAFFTTREVDSYEELTWDYGIDFDDLDHPIKAFRCRCGSMFCRNMKRSTRSRSAIIAR